MQVAAGAARRNRRRLAGIISMEQIVKLMFFSFFSRNYIKHSAMANGYRINLSSCLRVIGACYVVFRGKSAFPAISTDYFQTRSADTVSLHFIARYDTRSAARNSRGFICSQRALS